MFQRRATFSMFLSQHLSGFSLRVATRELTSLANHNAGGQCNEPIRTHREQVQPIEETRRETPDFNSQKQSVSL